MSGINVLRECRWLKVGVKMSEDYAGLMVKLTENLRQRNGGIAGMEYFYNFANRLYAGYLDELKAQNRKIIGVFCNFVPEELVYAAGAFPIRLCSGYQGVIKKAEQVMPANFCPAIKASYGMFLEDAPIFRASDVVVIPTTCDGKKKLGELIAETKNTWLLEVPHTNETPAARELWLRSIITFKKELEKFTGIKITASALRKSIEICNAKRAAIRRLYELRRGQNVPIWGRDVFMAVGMSFYDEPVRFTNAINALCDELERKNAPVAPGAKRILLTGSPIIVPAMKMANVIENSKLVIVADDMCTGSKTFHDPVMAPSGAMDDMMLAIAEKYLMNTCACFTPNSARLIRLQQMAKDWAVDGVVYYVTQACSTYNIEGWNIQKAFKAMNIPFFRIETDFSEQDMGQIKIRMEAFSEMIHGQIEDI